VHDCDDRGVIVEYGSFLGRGWAFPLDFSGGNAKMSGGEDDVEESLRILLNTYPGERLMRPEFGCRLRDFCFAEYNATLIAQIQECISHAILMFEPRVSITEVDVTKDEEKFCLLIEIHYVIRATNTRRNLVFPFYINEGTEASV